MPAPRHASRLRERIGAEALWYQVERHKCRRLAALPARALTSGAARRLAARQSQAVAGLAEVLEQALG